MEIKTVEIPQHGITLRDYTQKQPASVPVELSDDLLWKWFKESLKRRGLHDFDFFVLRDVAREAAAYGREQAAWDAMPRGDNAQQETP